MSTKHRLDLAAILADPDEYLRRGREETERIVAATLPGRAERIRRERLATLPGRHRRSITRPAPITTWRRRGRHRPAPLTVERIVSALAGVR